MKTLKQVFFIVLLTFVSSVYAQVDPVDKNGLAIGGYDVVAYFSNKAVKGNAKITATYNKATYQFSSTANRDAFEKNPTKYLPQFDGYCAWGVCEKTAKYPINPETFQVTNGKLYLFYNGPLNGNNFNAHEAWKTDEKTLLKTGDANWSAAKEKK